MRNGEIKVFRPDTEGQLVLFKTVQAGAGDYLPHPEAKKFTCVDCGGIDYRVRIEKKRCTACQTKHMKKYNKGYRKRQKEC